MNDAPVRPRRERTGIPSMIGPEKDESAETSQAAQQPRGDVAGQASEQLSQLVPR
jgi:hypothetical protein